MLSAREAKRLAMDSDRLVEDKLQKLLPVLESHIKTAADRGEFEVRFETDDVNYAKGTDRDEFFPAPLWDVFTCPQRDRIFMKLNEVLKKHGYRVGIRQGKFSPETYGISGGSLYINWRVDPEPSALEAMEAQF